MPPEDAAGLTGFHSYADGTPRADDPAPHEAPRAAYWRETPAYLDEMAPAEPTADWRRIAVVAGAAAGLTAAATFGWTVLQRRDAAPSALAEPPGVEVVVTDPPPPPALPKRARLEVLPSRTPVAVPPAATATPRPPVTGLDIPPPVASASALSAAPVVPRAEPRAAALRPAPAPRNAFNACRDAPTAARRMVCGDMRVAAADQRMKQAYAAALAAGEPPRRLQRDQAEWLEVREDAAQVSRGAVLDVYRQRTRELWAMARRRD